MTDGRELHYRNDLSGLVVLAENGLHQVTDHTYDLVGQPARAQNGHG